MSNVAACVRARLRGVAKAQGVDFNQVLVRFALERILYRLSQSEYTDRFLPKGALLFTRWYDMPHRATRDAGLLAKAQCKTQIDVGCGDTVTPAPVDSVYPVLLDDLPAPRLRTYPVYTIIAEKLHAIALLGMSNSRMKDCLDLLVLLERESLDIDLRAQAVKATFERRGMGVPAALLGRDDRRVRA